MCSAEPTALPDGAGQSHAGVIARAAERLAGASAPVPSPCVSVCRMQQATGHCEGCLRTIDEIMAWGAMSDPAKRAVWRLLEQRAAAVLAIEAALRQKPNESP